jgi:hypothetical protein
MFWPRRQARRLIVPPSELTDEELDEVLRLMGYSMPLIDETGDEISEEQENTER